MNTDTQTQQAHRRLTLSEYNNEFGPDLKGRIVEYDEPLNVAIYPDYGDGSISIMPTASIPKFGRYQRVEGGFGANLEGHGRMIMGPFFNDLNDAEADDRLEFNAEQQEALLDMIPRGKVSEVKGFKLSESTKETPTWVIIRGEE